MNNPESELTTTWRPLRWLLVAVVVLPTAVALFYALENWRGARALAQFHRELAAAGLPTQVEQILPPAIPDEQNLAMAPLLKPALAYHRSPVTGDIVWEDRPGETRLAIVSAVPPWNTRSSPALADWTKGERTDLSAWQRYYQELKARSKGRNVKPVALDRVTNGSSLSNSPPSGRAGSQRYLPASVAARYEVPAGMSEVEYGDFLKTLKFPVPPQPGAPAADVLMALSLIAPELDELARAAEARPAGRVPVHYAERPAWGILLPHLGHCKRLASVASLRASARLLAGDAAAAMSDIKLGFRVAELSRDEPFIVSQLVRFAAWRITLQPVWEGVVDHRWSDQQLAQLAQALGLIDFRPATQRCLQYEMLQDLTPSSGAEREQLGHIYSFLDNVSSPIGDAQEGLGQLFIRFGPRGWFGQNAVRNGRRHWHYLTNHLTWAGTPAVTNWNRLETQTPFRATPYSFVVMSELDRKKSVLGFVEKSLPARTWIQLTRAAIALERYRLAQRTYPSSMSELVPKFLSEPLMDPLDGAPLRYRLEPRGSYLLYSVGIDGADDGGRPAKEKESDTNSDLPGPEGDWVWPRVEAATK